MWLSKTMMVLETMNIYMLDILKEGLYVPLRTIIKEEKEPVTLRALVQQLTEDEKKKVNFDVRARAAICISLLYNVYHLVENYVYARRSFQLSRLLMKALMRWIIT
ncbi:unnamed protein product [Lactuca saligna]|uniref:Uncharacterized protein n=1 Tax=Lactuca saligna TaxID=75948 RepID=A0AA36A483_LACSI|nr:unnamed protein product [Lactuca saligna]